MLLSVGANYFNINDHGHTILHCIAARGDPATIAIISGLDLTGFDPGAKDELGRLDSESGDWLHYTKAGRNLWATPSPPEQGGVILTIFGRWRRSP